MIRPCLALIMPRITLRDSRKAPLKLVSITSSHCWSCIRIASVSCVTPALFTRIYSLP